MAPPPRYLITRKLVKRFFDRNLPKETASSTTGSRKLFECWEKHGVGSQKCKEFEALYDNIVEENFKYNQKLHSLDFKKVILSSLSKPIFHAQVKGRYRKPFHNLPKSIFDGVQ